MTDEMKQNIELVFQCIEKTGLELSIDISSFGQEKFEFLCGTISSEGFGPIEIKIDDFLENLNFATTARCL